MKIKKILFVSEGKAELVDGTLPDIEDDEVLVETEYSVVSAGTEKANLINSPNTESIGPFPRALGYSASGRVIKTGPLVTNYKVGDRVICDHLGHQSHVIAKAGKENVNGSIYKIENDISMLDAAFVIIGSMGVQGVRKAQVQLGESVMVTGLGILGMFAVQAALLNGGLPVIAVDFCEERRMIAKQLGADVVLSPADGNFYDTVSHYTNGRMINVNVEVTGSAAALDQALALAAWEGRITLTGCTRITDRTIDWYKTVHKPGIQIIGAHMNVRPRMDSYPGYWTRKDDYYTIMRYMALGKMTAKPMISSIVSPMQAPGIYDRLAKDNDMPLGIVFDWKEI